MSTIRSVRANVFQTSKSADTKPVVVWIDTTWNAASRKAWIRSKWDLASIRLAVTATVAPPRMAR